MEQTPKKDGFYGQESERTLIYAGPGDIIVMAPGTFHEVFTPVPSVTIGGHLYSYNALHLTELSRSLDKKTDEKFTNTSHPSSTLTVALMLAALPLLKDKGMFFCIFILFYLNYCIVLHQKPLAALCRMVQHPAAYSPPFQDVDFPAWKLWNKGSKKKTLEDFEFANKVANSLIKNLKLSLTVQHYPSKNPEKPDFIFDGLGFHDPGDMVEWSFCVPKLMSK
jgi:hypothetical protein